VPGRPDLIAIQRAYRAAETEKERYDWALAFEKAVKRDGSIMPLQLALGLGMLEEAEEGSPLQLWYDSVEGRAWLVEQGYWDWLEALAWFELLTGERTEDTRRVEAELSDWQWRAMDQIDEWKREGKLPESVSGPPIPSAPPASP
jgi:hypothetical protein